LSAQIGGLAPPLVTSAWLNSDANLTLEGLRGRVVVIEVFQMLCPGCVMHAMPQAIRLWQHYRASPMANDVVILGLHSVFEHHTVMNPQALAVYLYEFKIPFAVGVDRPGESSPLPVTMRAYGMRGTPTTLFIDRQGRLRAQHFGIEPDGDMIQRIDQLLGEG
jgi:thiol-disulfide isomerase/thioredoxin